MTPTGDKPTAEGGAAYAVFLSYNGDDRESVEKLAVHLADRAGLEPWFDRWYLVPGEHWVRNMERGLKASGACAVFVGRSGEGPWQKPEVDAALRFQVSRPGFRVIPVLLPDAPAELELPHFLLGHTWVDFRGRGLEDDAALWLLECGVRGEPPLRGRPPAQAPGANGAGAGAASPSAVAAAAASVNVRRAARPASVFVAGLRQEPEQTLGAVLAEALRRAGHNVFVDNGIRWGDDWAREVGRRLDGADYLLLLLSRESAASEMVAEELSRARELSKTGGGPVILPLRVCFPFEEPLPYQISFHLHHIQPEQWARPEDTARVIERLLGVVEGWGG